MVLSGKLWTKSGRWKRGGNTARLTFVNLDRQTDTTTFHCLSIDHYGDTDRCATWRHSQTDVFRSSSTSLPQQPSPRPVKCYRRPSLSSHSSSDDDDVCRSSSTSSPRQPSPRPINSYRRLSLSSHSSSDDYDVCRSSSTSSPRQPSPRPINSYRRPSLSSHSSSDDDYDVCRSSSTSSPRQPSPRPIKSYRRPSLSSHSSSDDDDGGGSTAKSSASTANIYGRNDGASVASNRSLSLSALVCV